MKNKFLENWKTWLLALAIVNLVALNAWVIRGVVSKKTPVMEAGKNKIQSVKESFFESEPVVTPALLLTGILDSCGSVCQAKIAEEVSKAMATVSGEKVVETKTVIKEVAPASSSDQAKVAYVPIVSSASNTKTTWTNVVPSEFYFDLNSYPGAKTVRFSCHLRAVHATGPVYVRLYDDTHKRGVDNSDFNTSSNSYQRFESAPLSIWRGNNKYFVQLRSPTATEAQLSEAKLKIEW